jgi:hypothetical protein
MLGVFDGHAYEVGLISSTLSHWSIQSFQGEFAVPPGLHDGDAQFYFSNSFVLFHSCRWFLIFSTEEIPWRLENGFPRHFSIWYWRWTPNLKWDPWDITPTWDSWNGAIGMLFNVTESNAPDIRSVRTSMRCWNDASEFSSFFLPCFSKSGCYVFAIVSGRVFQRSRVNDQVSYHWAFKYSKHSSISVSIDASDKHLWETSWFLTKVLLLFAILRHVTSPDLCKHISCTICFQESHRGERNGQTICWLFGTGDGHNKIR